MTPIIKGNSVILWGTLARDAPEQPRYFPSGKRVTNFSISYASQKKSDGSGWENQYINCSAWGDLADYATCLEKGDLIMLAGRLDKDKYRSEKKGEEVMMIVCDMIVVQGKIDNSIVGGASGGFEDLPGDDDGDLPF